MNMRCKVCGYIFKDKDEQICPECFTAREEDISCESYSHDDHCDDSYTHFKEMESKPQYFDETFDDDNSFIEDAIKEEKNNSFAKAEQKQADSVPMNGTYTENKSNTTQRNTNATYPYNSLNNSSQNRRTSFYSSSLNTTPKVQIKTKGGNNFPKIILLMIIMFSIVPSSCLSFFRNTEEKNTDYSSNTTTAKNENYKTLLDDQGCIAEFSVVRNNNPSEFVEKEQIDLNIYYTGDTVKEKDSIKVHINTHYKDVENKKKAKITSVSCISMNSEGNYTMMSSPEKSTEIEWGTSGDYSFYIDNDAEYIYISVHYNINGEDKSKMVKYEL